MTEFIRNNETFLRELAEGYTGNSAKAKEIAAEAKSDADPVRKVRLLSVMYVQQRDLDLFEHEETPKAGAEELREVRDIGRELIEMDYEERIVSLMKAYEHLSSSEIAAQLGISEEYVKALLQSAYVKAGHQQAREIDEPEELPPQPSEKNKKPAAPKISWKMILILAAVVVFLGGIFISVRSFSHSLYEKGMAEMESGDYESAVKSFRSAAAWGEGDIAVLRMADASFLGGDDVNAYTFYEDYYVKHEEDEYVRSQMVRCLYLQADRNLNNGNTKKAKELLERAATLKDSVYTEYRLKAIEEDGTWQREDGVVWNMYGRPVRAACLNDKGNVLYTVEIVYDEDGKWQKMTAGKSGTLRTSQYADFLFGEETVYDVRWIPGGDLPAAQAVSYTGTREDAQYEYDEDGNPTAMVIEHDSSDTSAFADYVKVVFVKNSYGETTEAEVYDRDDRKIGTGIYVPDSGWLYLYSVSR